MSKKIQTLMFLSISVLVFLLYVKIDREKKNNMLAAPPTSEADLQGPWGEEGRIDRTLEQSVAKSGVLDQVKGKLESIVLDEINVQFKKGVTSSLEWLMKIAEDDLIVSPTNGLVERMVDNSASEYIKCFPNGAQGEIPGDRVEIVYPVARGRTISTGFQGGDICKSHPSPSTIAKFTIGTFYHYGKGMPQDYSNALNWYRKASKDGFPLANFELGVLYHDGLGVAQSYKEAFEYFRKAADNGHAHSQRSLGIMFQLGRGVKPNHAEAAEWYREAALQGDPEAMAFLGYLYERGMGVRQDTMKADDIYFAAAKYADAEDLYSMGLGWDLDNSQPNDEAMACIWYRLAAHKGKKQGIKNCSALSLSMTAKQITHAEEISRQLIEKLENDVQGEDEGTTDDKSTGEING